MRHFNIVAFIVFLTITNVVKGEEHLWVTTPEIDLPLQLTSTASTFHLKVSSSVPDVLVLVAEGAQPDSLIVEYRDHRGTVVREVSGRRVALHERSIAMGGTIVRLPAVRDSTITLTIRYVDDAVPMILLRSLAVHERWVSTRQFVLAILYGLFVFAIVISLVFFAAFRDTSYLWYTAFLIAYLVNMLLTDSRWVVIASLAPITSAMRLGAVMPSISMLLALQFSRSFLGLRALSRRMDLIFIGAMFLCLVNAVVIPSTPMLSYLLFTAAPFLIITAAVMAIRRGHRYARFFITAWIVLSFSTIATVIFWWSGKSMGTSWLLRATMTGQLLIHVGGGIEVVLLTLAAAARLREQKRSEDILRAILPGSVVDRMIRRNDRIVDDVPSASIIFCDIVGFTSMANTISSEELVRRLDEVFSIMDDIARKHDIEKIKTIGDAYMAVSGAPVPSSDHAAKAVAFAIDTIRTTRALVTLRIGIHSGPVIAGVVGSWKFGYDVWGPTVNTASRLEAAAQPGTILISSVTAELAGKAFSVIDRGNIELRGVGQVHCYNIEVTS